jgi:hypothetical protein
MKDWDLKPRGDTGDEIAIVHRLKLDQEGMAGDKWAPSYQQRE